MGASIGASRIGSWSSGMKFAGSFILDSWVVVSIDASRIGASRIGAQNQSCRAHMKCTQFVHKPDASASWNHSYASPSM